MDVLVLLLLIAVIAAGAMTFRVSRRLETVADENRRLLGEVKRKVWDGDEARTRLDQDVRRVAGLGEEAVKSHGTLKDRLALLEQRIAETTRTAEGQSEVIRREVAAAGARADVASLKTDALSRGAMALLRLSSEAQYLMTDAQPDFERLKSVADDIEKQLRDLRNEIARRSAEATAR